MLHHCQARSVDDIYLEDITHIIHPDTAARYLADTALQNRNIPVWDLPQGYSAFVNQYNAFHYRLPAAIMKLIFHLVAHTALTRKHCDMKTEQTFKNLELTWSYITTCISVGCHDCAHNMLKYTEQQKDNDAFDFGDMASCPKCGCTTFDGVHPGLIL